MCEPHEKLKKKMKKNRRPSAHASTSKEKPAHEEERKNHDDFLRTPGLGASRQGISQPLQSMSAGGGMGVIDMHQADKKRWVARWTTGSAATAQGFGWACLGEGESRVSAFRYMTWEIGVRASVDRRGRAEG